MIDSQEETWILTEKYNGTPNKEYEKDIMRLRRGEPLAYVIGHIPFLDATIRLDSKPLIPRVETEYWMTFALKDMVENAPKNTRILDLCAGSGCIGISILIALSDAVVDFAEINIKHHATIKKNLLANDISEQRAEILGGDLFENVTKRYHYILSNPPYINPKLASRIDKSVLSNEPHEALFGGEGGMEIIERVINDSPEHLEDGGMLYIEHEPEQVKEIKKSLKERGFGQIKTFRDQYDCERVTQATFSY